MTAAQLEASLVELEEKLVRTVVREWVKSAALFRSKGWRPEMRRALARAREIRAGGAEAMSRPFS